MVLQFGEPNAKFCTHNLKLHQTIVGMLPLNRIAPPAT